MNIKPYRRKYPDVTKLLYEKGILATYPVQIKRDDLRYAEGIDIVYSLKGLTPAKFKEYSEALLWAAYDEARRYDEEPIKFARFDVQLNRTEKGRKVITKPIREFTARGDANAEVMIFGKQALGYVPTYFRGGTEVEQKSYLTNQIDLILELTEKYMKDYLNKQRPYKVIALVICIRRKL